jgi:predicted outer membrane repeat protein
MVNCNFVNNSARSGGGMVLFESNFNLRAWNDNQQLPLTIQGNRATEGGGFMEAYSSIIMIEQYHFHNNSAQNGGVLAIWDTDLTLVGTNDSTASIVFEDNIATIQGGVIEARDSSIITTLNSTVLFRNNIAYSYGGAIVTERCTVQMWSCHFIGNNANVSGGAMFLRDSTVTLNNSDNPKFPIEFRNNKAQQVCHMFILLT